jgi:hypothetical protein
MRVVSGLIFFVAMAVLPSACLDMPIQRVAKVDKPRVEPDAGEDGGLTPAAACRACMAAPEDPGPGCQTPYDACVANGMCRAMIDCGFVDRCFLGPRRDFLTCATPCLTKAGVDNMNAEILGKASGLFFCLSDACGNICFVD